MTDFSRLPAPEDDGAADHVTGSRVPGWLPAGGTLVAFVYPMTGTPGKRLPDNWDQIPGARGCTDQSCAFRDHHEELAELGATVVGISAQPPDEQVEFAEREHIPYQLLNDAELRLARELELPTFEVQGRSLYRRLTFIARDGEIVKVFYPVFPPDRNAADVADWLRENRPRTVLGHISASPRVNGLKAQTRKGRTMQADISSKKIAVTGATGRVGAPLVEVLEQRGHEVVPIARSKGVDVVSGEGLDAALAGVEIVIDAATGPSPDQTAATEFFTASARNLQRAASAAGVERIVVVSIIGIDKFQGGYNAAKAAQEQTLLAGPLPVRIVRAAQFHEFVDELVGWMIQDGVAYLPEFRTQLVAARVVAEALADAAEEPEIQSGTITEVAGPQEERLADAAAALFASRGDSFEIREVRQPGDPDAEAYAEGAALPNPGAKLAGPRFEDWLAAA